MGPLGSDSRRDRGGARRRRNHPKEPGHPISGTILAGRRADHLATDHAFLARGPHVHRDHPGLFRLFRLPARSEVAAVTEEDVRALVQLGLEEGEIEAVEREIIDALFDWPIARCARS